MNIELIAGIPIRASRKISDDIVIMVARGQEWRVLTIAEHQQWIRSVLRVRRVALALHWRRRR